jgi:superfamily I DNA and RNA helicase
MNFNDLKSHLNPEQKKAVEQIYGPILVLAGPGTGKTQMLTVRIAEILAQQMPIHKIFCVLHLRILVLSLCGIVSKNGLERPRTKFRFRRFIVFVSE